MIIAIELAFLLTLLAFLFGVTNMPDLCAFENTGSYS
jgi:hypothetical protein